MLPDGSTLTLGSGLYLGLTPYFSRLRTPENCLLGYALFSSRARAMLYLLLNTAQSLGRGWCVVNLWSARGSVGPPKGVPRSQPCSPTQRCSKEGAHRSQGGPDTHHTKNPDPPRSSRAPGWSLPLFAASTFLDLCQHGGKGLS